MSKIKGNNVSVEEATPIQQLRMALDRAIYEHNKDLEGKLLTLADATFNDPEQRKAFKDMARQIIWNIGFPCSTIAMQFSAKFDSKTIKLETWQKDYYSKPENNYFMFS